MIVLYDMLFKIYFWPNCQNLTNEFVLVSENSLPLLLRCLYGRFFFPKIPILGHKYFLFSQVLLLQIVLYSSSFQRLIIINSDIDLLKTKFWQTTIWSQSMLKILQRLDKDEITFKAIEKCHQYGLLKTVSGHLNECTFLLYYWKLCKKFSKGAFSYCWLIIFLFFVAGQLMSTVHWI